MSKNIVENILEPLDGYLASLKRNTIEGWYELEVGLPKDWVYKETNLIECKVIIKSDDGVLVKVAPKEKGITVDDLIDYVQLIVETNERIESKEQEFKESITQVKKDLEEKAKKFYEELDKMKEITFTEFDEKLNQHELSIKEKKDVKEDDKKESSTPVKKKRGRKPKIKLPDDDE